MEATLAMTEEHRNEVSGMAAHEIAAMKQHEKVTPMWQRPSAPKYINHQILVGFFCFVALVTFVPGTFLFVFGLRSLDD